LFDAEAKMRLRASASRLRLWKIPLRLRVVALRPARHSMSFVRKRTRIPVFPYADAKVQPRAVRIRVRSVVGTIRSVVFAIGTTREPTGHALGAIGQGAMALRKSFSRRVTVRLLPVRPGEQPGTVREQRSSRSRDRERPGTTAELCSSSPAGSFSTQIHLDAE
jgi:hypothetical protein